MRHYYGVSHLSRLTVVQGSRPTCSAIFNRDNLVPAREKSESLQPPVIGGFLVGLPYDMDV